jgi:hypothetical protein
MLESVPRHNFVAFKLNPPRILDLQLPARKYLYYFSAQLSPASGYGYIISAGNSSTDTIFSMALDKNILWIGGSSPDSLPTGPVGLDVQTGGMVTGLPSVNGKVYTVAAEDTNIWIGGNFRTVNTDSVNGLVRLDPNTRTVKKWLPQSTAVNFPVKTLGLTRNRIRIGSPAGLGGFRTVSLQPANCFYTTDAEITNISTQNNEVYVSGSYTTGLTDPNLSVIKPRDSLSTINFNYRLSLGSSIFPPFIGRPNSSFVINHNIDYFSVATKLNNSVIAGGLFNLLQQKTRYNLAGFSLQKDDDFHAGLIQPIIEDWNPDLDIKVIPNCLAISGDTVWIGTNNSILGFRKCLKSAPAPIRVLGLSVFCKGDSVELRTSVTSNSLYWIVNNKHIPVRSGSIYIKENAVVYLQDSSDCSIWTNKVPVQISVGNSYTMRLKTVSDTILAVGAGENGSHQWYQSGALIAETTYPKSAPVYRTGLFGVFFTIRCGVKAIRIHCSLLISQVIIIIRVRLQKFIRILLLISCISAV